MSQTTLPRVPGRDFAGVVEVGPEAWLGMDVCGSGNAGFTRDGSHAQYYDAEYIEPQNMLAELRDDNLRLTSAMHEVHYTCDDYHDVATASLLEVWIEETERRTSFLYECYTNRKIRTGACDLMAAGYKRLCGLRSRIL